MSISKSVWRFQCDPNGESDPIVQVFLRSEVTVDGKTFIENSTDPVPMKFSELAGGLHDLVNAEKIDVKRRDIEKAKTDRAQKEAEAAAKAAAASRIETKNIRTPRI